MKLKLLAILLITTLFSCERQLPSTKVEKADTVKFAVGCQPIDTTAEKGVINARMLANEPDFWNSNYRSYKVCTLYVEVAYNIYVNEGYNAPNAEAKMRALINVASKTSERLTGVKFVIGDIKVNTVQDVYYLYRDAPTALYYFGQNTMNNPQPFKVFLTDANIGGAAYISAGSVTSAKYAFVSLARTRPIDQFTFTYGHSSLLHELYHILGLSHSHNDCAWLDRNGNRIGPLDSCASCENNRACPPSLKCVTTTKRMRGDIMSYCHIYGTTELFLKEPELAVLHKSLYYSSLPNYTPTTPPTIGMTVDTIGIPYQKLGFKLARDNNFSINTSRWVVAGPSSVTFNNVNRNIGNLTLYTGFLNTSWNSPVKSIQVIVNGTQVFATTTNNLTTIVIPINSNVVTLRILFRDTDFNRVREIVF